MRTDYRNVAMVGHGHGVGDAVQVIQWHVLGMFAPSFYTGTLIARFGAPPATKNEGLARPLGEGSATDSRTGRT